MKRWHVAALVGAALTVPLAALAQSIPVDVGGLAVGGGLATFLGSALGGFVGGFAAVVRKIDHAIEDKIRDHVDNCPARHPRG